MTALIAAMLLAQTPTQANPTGQVWDREVVLSSFADAKPLGRVEIFIKLLGNGGARRKTISTFFAETGKTYITDEEEWDAIGRHTSFVRKTRIGTDAGQVMVSYTATGAVLSLTSPGRAPESLAYEIPEGSVQGDPSRNWVLKHLPAEKTEEDAARFDLDRMAWVKSKVSFEGKTSLVLRGQTHEAFVIKDDQGTTQWLDDKGLLIKQEVADEAGLIKWERVSSKVLR